MGFCDLVVMHLRDFKIIIGMDFLTQVEVSIMPYLRTLAFLEKGTPCTMMAMENHAMKTEKWGKVEFLNKTQWGLVGGKRQRAWEALAVFGFGTRLNGR